MNAARDSYLLNSNVAFLKSGQNAAGICLFFYGASAMMMSLKKVKFIFMEVCTQWLKLGLVNCDGCQVLRPIFLESTFP